MRSRESELAGLRERAHGLWDGQGAGKSFVHRVCQLAACYLALSNLIKVTSSTCVYTSPVLCLLCTSLPLLPLSVMEENVLLSFFKRFIAILSIFLFI